MTALEEAVHALKEAVSMVNVLTDDPEVRRRTKTIAFEADQLEVLAELRATVRPGLGEPLEVITNPELAAGQRWFHLESTYRRLREESPVEAEELALALAARLGEEPSVDAIGFKFFATFQTAPGGQRLHGLVEERLDDYTDVPTAVVDAGGDDLRAALLHAATAYNRISPPESVLQIARAEALRPGRAVSVGGTLWAWDGAFMEANFDAILTGTPAAAGPAFAGLVMRGWDPEAALLRVTVYAEGVAELRGLGLWIIYAVEDPEIREELLGLLVEEAQRR